MKKIFTLAAIISISNIAYADQVVNLNITNLMCGKYKITTSSTPSELKTNCKVVKSKTEKEFFGKEDKVKFNTDDGSYVECKFRNDKLSRCKFED